MHAQNRSGFRPDIQGLRGLAVLLVVIFHIDEAITGGYVGVDVFFVVSGFVITSLLLRGSRTTGRVPIRRFFERRVRRLLPLLSVTLTATALLGVVLLSPLGASEVTAKTAGAAALLNANTFLQRQAVDYFGVPTSANALLHTWSLSVEEQFYLVFPFLVVAGAALRRRTGQPTRKTIAAVAVVATASFALYGFLLADRLDGLVTSFGFASGTAVGFYSAPARAWEFLAGAGVAVLAPRIRSLPRPLLDAAGVVGVITVIAAGISFTPANGVVAGWMIVPVVGTVLLLSSGFNPASPTARVLAIRPLVWVGDRSYGWYLFHWPLIVFAAANSSSAWAKAIAATVALPVAAVAKRLIEDRFRFNDRLTGRRAILLTAGCIALPVLSAAGAVLAARGLADDNLIASADRHIDSKSCNRRTAAALTIAAEACVWTTPGSKGLIVLIGDSHASMWSEAVIGAGNGLGYDVSIATMSGCPALTSGATRLRDGEFDMECRDFMARSFEEIQALRPDLVIMASATLGLLNPTEADDGRWRLPDGTRANDRSARKAILEEGLRASTTSLASAGIRSLIVHDVPYHPFSSAQCSWIRYRLSPRSCASNRDRRTVEAELEGSRSAELRAAAADGLSSTIDPLPWLCNENSCSTYRDGLWSYRDRDHISVAAAKALVPEMRDALASTLK